MPKAIKKEELFPFADKLREAVRRSGLSQADIACKLGLKQTTISAYCCGRTKPDKKRIRKLEDILKLKEGTLSALLPDEGGVREKAVPKTTWEEVTTSSGNTESAQEDGSKRGPKAVPSKPAAELMNLPWAMPAQIGHMRKVLDRYETEMVDVFYEKYTKEDVDIRNAKQDFMSYAKQDFKVVRQALADLEHQMRCFLGLPG